MAFAYTDLMVPVYPLQPNLEACPQDTMPPTTTFCGQVTAITPGAPCPQDTLIPPTGLLGMGAGENGLGLLQQQLRMTLSQISA
jgi:hypothetical protein